MARESITTMPIMMAPEPITVTLGRNKARKKEKREFSSANCFSCFAVDPRRSQHFGAGSPVHVHRSSNPSKKLARSLLLSRLLCAFHDDGRFRRTQLIFAELFASV